MTTIQFNATGRWVLRDQLPNEHPLRERITESGIMDEIEFTHDEAAELAEVAEGAHATSVHWLNTKMRIKRAVREANEVPA